jgi:hypothetical protein
VFVRWCVFVEGGWIELGACTLYMDRARCMHTVHG